MVIIWSQPAREDLRLIHQYIAHDSKRYAKRVIQDITDTLIIHGVIHKRRHFKPDDLQRQDDK